MSPFKRFLGGVASNHGKTNRYLGANSCSHRNNDEKHGDAQSLFFRENSYFELKRLWEQWLNIDRARQGLRKA